MAGNKEIERPGKALENVNILYGGRHLKEYRKYKETLWLMVID